MAASINWYDAANAMRTQRIYLACTVRGDRGGVVAGRHLARLLQARGHEVLTGHLLRDDVEAAESRLTEAAVFGRDLEWLERCDALIAEASASSFGVGFEVGYVLARAASSGQRVFLLYDAAQAARLSRLILGNCHEHCVRIAYQRLEDLDAFVERYF